jgi:hypothetical protein
MLQYLDLYFNNRLLPQEPEEAAMTRIILAVQNILEYETELAIAIVASRSSKPRDRDFQRKIEEGYVSFKSKFEWLRKRGLISQADEKVMDAIREIRNEHVHWRPSATRRKLKYFGTPLLTRRAVKRILCDVQPIVGKLRGIFGSTEMFGIVPPGYFDEVQVP